ncbi:MAG: VanZ family protein [Thermoanaerobaculia bacterium]
MVSHERRWWLASLALIVLIYATLYFVRGPVEFLRERNLLRLAVLAAFASAAVPVLWLLWRHRPGPREGVVIGIFAAVFFGLLTLTSRPEEKLHFLEYGLLAGMLHTACRLRAARLGGDRSGAELAVALQAAVLAALAGVGDELIQAVLPNRFFDVRDIVFNVVASLVVVAALATAARVRPSASAA